jgi:hypothetical protein
VHIGQGRHSLTADRPWLVAFGFGLLHGLGFAGALAEVGLPETAIPLALLTFNVGVEAGQLLFVAPILVLGLAARQLPSMVADAARQVTAYGIGTIATIWTFERLASYWA